MVLDSLSKRLGVPRGVLAIEASIYYTLFLCVCHARLLPPLQRGVVVCGPILGLKPPAESYHPFGVEI